MNPCYHLLEQELAPFPTREHRRMVARMQLRSAAPSACILLSAMLISCSTTDKSGAERHTEPTILHLASRTLGSGPAAAFSDEVDHESGGRITIQIDASAHRDSGRGSDAAILADVVNGVVPLGLVSVEALQQAGVRTLDPLVAPGVVTSVGLEVEIARGPLGGKLLGGLSAASVIGIAIAPGPIHHLVGVGTPVNSPLELTGQRFGVYASSVDASALASSVGADPVIDERSQLDTDVRALDASPGVIARRNLVGFADHLMGNAPLWPDPTIIVMNPGVFERLAESDQNLLLEAGRLAASSAGAEVDADESSSLGSLCADGEWTIDTMPAAGLAALTADLLAAGADMRSDSVVAALLAEVGVLAAATVGPTPIVCPTTNDGEPAATATVPLTGPAKNLIGTWSANVTQAALDRAGISPTEFGEVGPTRLVFDESGHVDVVLGDGTDIPATAVVDGGTLEVSPIPESLQDGRGETWRYRWSVFNGTLTLERVAGPDIDPGPTSLVSQAFTATASIPSAPVNTEAAIADDIVVPGESWILYQDSTTYQRVFLVRPDGTGRHSPTPDLPGTHQTNPDWSPDGQRLTFIITEDGTEDLWVANVDGTDAERVVDCQDPCLVIDDPSWSPDGRSIVYSRTIGGRGTSENTVEVFDPESGAITVLLGGDPTVFYAGARWSPDSQSIVLEVVRKAGPDADAEITGVTLSIIDITTSPPTVTAITDPALFAATADWSPNGELIVYSALAAPEDQAPDLFTIHPDGSGRTRITHLAADGGSAAEPTFTPDSARIVFAAQLEAGGDVVLAAVDLDGSNMEPATSDGYHHGRHPRVRPAS